MLRYSNEQLREAVEEGDADPQVTTAIAENIEIIEAREVRVEQLTTLLDALRAHDPMAARAAMRAKWQEHRGGEHPQG